ncbi:hypothetical protein [Sulfurimonas sp.]|uniref:hypothetical protein n=1 Tax=Sulfurimonas sp. TaxID=2022749 RepID=UPI00260DD5F2|nr:hypothetical protein [Sulfurimonas sp.]
MNHEEKLLYIENASNQKLFYHFTPASIVSNFVPLIVILHNDDISEIVNFEYKMWNILTPLRNLDDKENSFFEEDLLQKLITDIAQEYECEDHIYLYGSSIGGYEAILQGIKCQANAVTIDFCPESGDEHYQLKKVLDMFERMVP